MIQRIDIDTSKKPTPQFNKAKSIKTKSTTHNKMLFKDAVALPPHIFFHILSYQITPDSTSNGFNSTGEQGTSNLTLKIFLVTISITNND